jgi:ketosteroid isomerase-like protein
MSAQISPDIISRAVRAYFLAIRAMDADALANNFAQDGTTFDPAGTPGITGRAAIRDFLVTRDCTERH